MIFYHYSTWPSTEIIKRGTIKATDFYGRYALSQGKWPELVFLTSDPYWEYSVKATTPDGEKLKGSSDPDEYTKLGIPCYRFEVEIKDTFKLMYPHPFWLWMFQDAKRLGSDVSKWYWTEEDCTIGNTARWKDGKWLHVPTKDY